MYSINLESADFKSHIIQYILQHLAENERISEYPNRIRLFLGLPNLTFGISSKKKLADYLIFLRKIKVLSIVIIYFDEDGFFNT